MNKNNFFRNNLGINCHGMYFESYLLIKIHVEITSRASTNLQHGSQIVHPQRASSVMPNGEV